MSLNELAAGGEAIVYEITSAGFDELVVKVPKNTS
jgi:hypothetical protein